MTELSTRTPSAGRSGTDLPLQLGLVAVLLFFAAAGGVSYRNTSAVREGTELVNHTYEVLSGLDDVLSAMKDAETGQRGFLIMGEERFLEPYDDAVPRIGKRLEDLARLTVDNAVQQRRLPSLEANIKTRLRVIAQTIELRRTQGFDAGRDLMATDRGKEAMDAVRAQVAVMQDDERKLLQVRLRETNDAFWIAVGGGIVTCVLGACLAGAVGVVVRRADQARKKEEWLLSGQSGLSAAMLGDLRLEELGDSVLKFLAERLDAHAGAMYAKHGNGYRRVATYGAPHAGGAPERFTPGDGLLGQAVKDGRTFFVEDVPEGYLQVGSALGRSSPRRLLVAPFTADGVVNAVVELGFLHAVDPSAVELLERTSEPAGVAVRSAEYRAELQNLLEETQRQAEEVQAQGEELRVSNEELEEQSRALRESQGRLEQQQAELELTNLRLEEQGRFLEAQRDDLAKSAESLQAKARELEQASRYKSDFLANMSHELRTPLNSSLILAKLLSDNPEGNLSAEQVQYAETIRSAGNDLLALINDILDLSKIEAGHMEVRPEPVRLSELVDRLARTVAPIAAQQGLTFTTRIAPDCPATVETDRQRLEQILKNLVSNALKFTEQGEVSLTVSRSAAGRIAFAVADTGIGIAGHQQQLVFEAFRQADGAANRKYGGTGLGLSISRELARLLGGDIRLESEPGRGSTFTVNIPEEYDPSQVRARVLPPVEADPPTPGADGPRAVASAAPKRAPEVRSVPAPTVVRRRRVEDDRERLTGGVRTILVVEDDEPFARILFDLAHELEFQCLVAATAEEGLAMATQHLPSAVLLDVGLPDHSGLTVLDRLKRDARTRHIPVHVVSAGDYAQTALSLGAVGYMLKPVKREEMVDALKRLETRFAQRMRRVLVVEDDPVQLDSLRKLLGSHDVETVGAASAAECLERLRGSTFDCMVLDLTLPDASGYSLLETLCREDAYSFPPVIVYTGRELPADEEQRLRRYSKSIIIKGAKSPERLLDEVTLFLHQVVSELPAEQQKMLERARNRDSALEGRRILVVEDDVRNVFALSSILEPRGAVVQIARNGFEALAALEKSTGEGGRTVDLVLMDVMMPEMDGLTAVREIRKRPEWKKLPIVMLTAKAMRDDQERCLEAGANDYLAKPLDVEKLLSLVRVWMPR